MKKHSITMFQVPPLMVFEYEGDINKDLEYISNIEYIHHDGGLSSRSKSDYILDDNNLKELKQFCLDSVHEYVDEIVGLDDEIEIQQSWVNLHKHGQNLFEHHHPNSFISGVFYFASDQENGSPITFRSDLYKSNFYVQKLSDRVDTYYPSNAHYFQHPSIPGQLLLFSSTVSHMVQANGSDTDRISLSFNTFPKLPFGNKDGLNVLR